jgi:hypothetical protein
MSKILVPYSSECPASIAGLCGLFSYMQEKQLRIPVILVPLDEVPAEVNQLLEKEAPFGLQTGAKTGSSLILGAGVKQLPVYIVLDGNNLIETIHYELEDLKTAFLND